MKEKILNTSVMIKVQQWLWYFFILLFSITVIMNFLKIHIAEQLSEWAIFTIIIATAIRLIVLSELYRRAFLYKYWILSVALLIILFGTILLQKFY